MKTYLVTWEIEIDADSPRDAAQKALDIQRDPDSLATVFDVIDCESGSADPYKIDLCTDDDDGCPKNDPDCLSNADESHDACGGKL